MPLATPPLPLTSEEGKQQATRGAHPEAAVGQRPQDLEGGLELVHSLQTQQEQRQQQHTQKQQQDWWVVSTIVCYRQQSKGAVPVGEGRFRDLLMSRPWGMFLSPPVSSAYIYSLHEQECTVFCFVWR